MPGPGLDLGGTKASLEKNLEYWRNKASEPCPRCAARAQAEASAASEKRLRLIIREEIVREKTRCVP